MRVLVTGGLGFIGAHSCVEFAREGSRLVILDNLANSKHSVLERIRELAPGADIDFVRAGVRDYIHVMDLAAGHLAALRYLNEKRRSITVNLGTGRGYSVLEIVKAFEKAAGKPVPCEVVARRPGDIAAYYADTALAANELGWRARFGVEDMCRDAWRWQSANPSGYPD